MMRGHIVWAAAVLGLCFIQGGGLMAAGIWMAMDRAAGRLEATLQAHARSTEQAGAAAGVPVREAVLELTAATEKHAGAIERSGKLISLPVVKIQSPIAVEQPVRIMGPRDDGALPVNARVGN
jgi:hypothetical protein